MRRAGARGLVTGFEELLAGPRAFGASLLRGHMRWDGDPHQQGVVGKVNGMPNVENALMGISVISTVLPTRWSLASLGVPRSAMAPS